MDSLGLVAPRLSGQSELEGRHQSRSVRGEKEAHRSVRGVITSLPLLPRYS